MNHKMIAVVGSPGSGTTTTTVKLAMELEKQGKTVMIIFLDIVCATIPYIIPNGSDHNESIGALFTSAHVSRDDILRTCVTVPGHDKIVLLGYKMDDCYSLYPKMLPEKIRNVLLHTKHLTDYVIIDCVSMIEADTPTITALQISDNIVRLGTADLKGISYYSSMNRILSDPQFAKKTEHIWAVSNLWAAQPVNMVSERYGGTKFFIPHCAEIANQCESQRLFDECVTKEGLQYSEKITLFSESIFGIESESMAAKVEKAKEEKTKKQKADSKTSVPEKEKEAKMNIKKPQTGTSKAHNKPKGPFGLLRRSQGEW